MQDEPYRDVTAPSPSQSSSDLMRGSSSERFQIWMMDGTGPASHSIGVVDTGPRINESIARCSTIDKAERVARALNIAEATDV